ncbi:hypothetical protein NYR60_03065 [Actinobacillus genomosp. 2]|uniref:hypothetical protein n=1 Tax=Actinobacillus genomosp. 2 TaxID=230709 RepID=UPI0024430FDB|nr:hypothetical protein [Actinobacillus genomosp. 2]WGE32606.1 hypothetical protein NYR60_03065 [Actinobacillus genomosp. 2]
MITKQKLKLKRGDDHSFRLTFKQNGAFFNLSQVARIDLQAIYRSTVVLNISTESGLIEKLSDNSILLNIPHTLTENDQWVQAQYDLQFTFRDGKVRTVMEGNIELSHDITIAR